MARGLVRQPVETQCESCQQRKNAECKDAVAQRRLLFTPADSLIVLRFSC